MEMVEKGFQHGLQPAHDLGKLRQQSAAAQLPGVMHVGLKAQDAFAFGMNADATRVRPDFQLPR